MRTIIEIILIVALCVNATMLCVRQYQRMYAKGYRDGFCARLRDVKTNRAMLNRMDDDLK